jgi:diguanylate cyclase (GGDEF)-like protein
LIQRKAGPANRARPLAAVGRRMDFGRRPGNKAAIPDKAQASREDFINGFRRNIMEYKAIAQRSAPPFAAPFSAVEDDMPQSPLQFWPQSKPAPDDVFGEQVAILFGNLEPVVGLGVVITAIGAVIAATKSDVFALLLTIGCTLVTLVQVASILAYRRRVAASPLPVGEARVWERRYAVGSLALACALGALSARASVMDDPLIGMLTLALIFGYTSGMVARMSIRPAICLASLILSTAPTIIAFGAHVGAAGGYPPAAVFATQAFLIAAFGVASLGAVEHVHAMTMQQLLAKRELALLAGRDTLTGLPNRSLLRARFAEAVARTGHSGDILAIHCLDLDQFKAVNDRYGHPTGDALLLAISERLARTLRTDDTVARLGGDEFVVVQCGIRDADQAQLLAERIIQSVGARYQIDGHEVEIGVSVGVALAPRDGIDLDQLSSRADAALHRAKRGSRGVVFWGEAPGPDSIAVAGFDKAVESRAG